jgi:hypothetical protein
MSQVTWPGCPATHVVRRPGELDSHISKIAAPDIARADNELEANLRSARAAQTSLICLPMPSADDDELQNLTDDIRAQGLLDPIVLFEKRILGPQFAKAWA